MNDESIGNILDEAIEQILVVLSYRRGVLYSVPKSTQWSQNILTVLDDNRFLQLLRVNRTEFEKLVLLISDDPLFNNLHSPKQFPVSFQLAIVLYRLGSSGEGASLKKIGALFGVGDGGTIDKITRRVFNAFLNQQSRHIFWPDEGERSAIVAATYDELPFCIGYIDGSEIALTETPVMNPVSFFSRTHKYSVKAQMICDYLLRIRNVVVGHPGSHHDSKIFKNCEIYKESGKYFASNQWIAGDSAYPLSSTVITPYRRNSTQMDITKRTQFNKIHSKYRVRIEHCFGILKEKFSSLKNLKMRINSSENHLYCCQWIMVCCILHNILIPDTTLNIFEEISENDREEINEETCEEMGPENRKHELKRQALFSLMFD